MLSLQIARVALVIATLCIACRAHQANAFSAERYTVSLVKDIRPGPLWSQLDSFTVFGDALYFKASDGTHGAELYASDGSTVSLVADIYPGFLSSFPGELTVLDDRLYFSTTNVGFGLAMYDGLNVSAVRNVNGDLISPKPSEMTAFGGELVYRSSAFNGSLHAFDGDELRRIGPTSPTLAHQFTQFEDLLYFRGTGAELFTYDGEQIDGVAGINPFGGTNPLWMTPYSGSLYMHADNGLIGGELFKYDETGYREVADLRPGALGSGPRYLTEFAGKLLFTADNGSSGRELFEYDGESARLVADINPGAEGSNPSRLIKFDGRLFFAAYDVATGYELYAYDGFEVARITDINPGVGGSISGGTANTIAVLNGELLFAGDDGIHGGELFKLVVVPEPASVLLVVLALLSVDPQHRVRCYC